MTLAEKTKLIDDMVKENPDATIKDYLELAGDIETISKASENLVTLTDPIEIEDVKAGKKSRKERDSKVIRKYHSVFRPNI